MRGFHVNWTRPFSVRAPGLPYAVEPFELLTTALSALCWRRENGGICMVCDSPAAEYYASLGLDFLWDEGIFPLLDRIPDDINAGAFWARQAVRRRRDEIALRHARHRPYLLEKP